MKKAANKSVSTKDIAQAQKAINYYDHQSDDEGAKEIESASLASDKITWLEIPTELVPEVKKLINRHRRTA